MTHVAIVGAYGSAGVAAAEALVDADWDDLRLTLIDDGDPGGGLCIRRGCMPSKDVLSAAQHRSQARHDDRLEGVPDVDPEAVVARKDEHVAEFAAHRTDYVHELAEREGVEFLADRARFLDDRVLAVGDRTLEPEYVIVATGSTVNVPDLEGIDAVDFDTSADVLDATDFPDSAVAMGFGYVGLELAPYLSEVGGVDLTVIEHDDRPLHEFEPEYGETILDLYRERFGIDVLTNATEERVESTADGVRLHLERDGEREAVEADRLYCFTGRRPNLDGLGLERTRLEPGEGWVESTMQARDDERVFVVGDANGREPILHVAKEQGFAAAENVRRHARARRAGRDPDLRPYANIPHHVIFSGLGSYPFARIGHTPETAAESAMETIAVTREASSDGVFAVKGHPEGRATLLVDAAEHTVVGFQALHLHADVMAKTVQVLVETGVDVHAVPKRSYHPTTPEILDGLLREACERLGDEQQCVGRAGDSDLAL